MPLALSTSAEMNCFIPGLEKKENLKKREQIEEFE